MGFSLSWLAVKGISAQAVREQLDLRLTGEQEKVPDSDLTSIELPDGWYLIVSNHTEAVASDATMQRLSSAGAELVTCFVEEHVMFSSATSWKHGKKTWSVIHNAQKKRDHLETEGELPAAFASILADLKTKQREADANKRNVDFIFEVPVMLAASLVGFVHDRDTPELKGKVFEVLSGKVPESVSPPRRPSFLQRLFGA